MKREINKIREDALADIFQDLKILASFEQIEKLEEQFSYHLDMEQEFSAPTPSYRDFSCDKCKILENKIKELEKDIEVYRNSVKIRRNADHVWIDRGSVMYE